MSFWRPDKFRGDWRVVFDDGKNPRVWCMEADRPLTFWNEKSAQIKADSLNRKDIRP